MSREALENFHGSFCIAEKLINTLHYADDVVLTATSVEEQLVSRIMSAGKKFWYTHICTKD